MERLERASILLSLNEELRQAGSWAGETHMQKATFFLQELMSVPLRFDFVLYKHGPFSFDLRDELTFMRSQEFLGLEPQYPYGPKLLPGPRSELLKSVFKESIQTYAPKVQFVSQKLGTKPVAGLEKIATALYVVKLGETHLDNAERLVNLKPHIALPEAKIAVSEVEQIAREASLR